MSISIGRRRWEKPEWIVQTGGRFGGTLGEYLRATLKIWEGRLLSGPGVESVLAKGSIAPVQIAPAGSDYRMGTCWDTVSLRAGAIPVAGTSLARHPLACTIAMMPARTAGGSVAHASHTAARAGSAGTVGTHSGTPWAEST